MQTQRVRSTAGFTLIELMVAMAVTLFVLAGAVAAVTQTTRANEVARSVTGMNNHLRIGMDLIVRDLIQVGQGLPTGRVVQIPAGVGSLQVRRPAPPGDDLFFPDGATEMSAVTPGPGLGPQVNGVPTDILTVLVGDTVFENVPLTALGASSMTVSAVVANGGHNIGDGGADDIAVGDLLMLTRGTFSCLMYATGVAAQVVTFDGGDPMDLNQYDATLTLTGTLNQLAASPGGVAATRATRIRMVTYFLDTQTDPAVPRLSRRINDQLARTVAFGIENLQVSFDLVDGVTNPSNVRLTDDDLDVGGACAPSACDENQIRKVNLVLSGRSRQRFTQTREFFRNTLATQVSLRSLAFVDRYR